MESAPVTHAMPRHHVIEKIKKFCNYSERCEQEVRESMESANIGPRLNRWQAFNQRLNEMLGFV